MATDDLDGTPVNLSVSDVERFLSTNWEFVKDWVKKNVPRSTLETWRNEKHLVMHAHGMQGGTGAQNASQAQRDSIGGSDRGRQSTTGNLFEQLLRGTQKRSSQPRKSRNELMKMSHKDMFMELIRDIATELDVNVLCHKILMNVCVLINGDRGSLFLARGTPENKYLVSKLFDVTEHSTLEECLHTEENHITVPFGKGIAGSVAMTKQPINISDAYQDSRFNKNVDKQTGYHTKSILCMPILDNDGEVIGVAQIVNKLSDEQTEFSAADERVFRDYLSFAGIGLTSAQMFEISIGELKQNQLLLRLAKGIFAEQSSMDMLVQRIMLDSQDLIKCIRCNVYLVNTSTATQQTVEFYKAFEMHADKPDRIIIPSVQALQKARSTAFAKSVAKSGQMQSIADAVADPQYNQEIADYDGFKIKSLISVPVVNGEMQVIGVVQILNKANSQPFTDSDVQAIELYRQIRSIDPFTFTVNDLTIKIVLCWRLRQTFAIFCGLGVHNCQLHESIIKLNARHKVTIEVLVYHAVASSEDSAKLASRSLLTVDEYKLLSFDFLESNFDDFGTCEVVLKMFTELDVTEKFSVSMEVLSRWILTIQKSYRPILLHNWRQAVSVTQTLFAMLWTAKLKRFFDDLEIFALLVAGLCHSIDHRGVINSRLPKDSPFLKLYDSSAIQHHHYDQFLIILNSEGTNVFQHLQPDDNQRALNIVESAIIATDTALFLKKKRKIAEAIAGGKDWQDPVMKEHLKQLMMTGSVVSYVTKAWSHSQQMSSELLSDYITPGERDDHGSTATIVSTIAGADQHRDETAVQHLAFIDNVCVPVYQMLVKVDSSLSSLMHNAITNRANWKFLIDHRKR